MGNMPGMTSSLSLVNTMIFLTWTFVFNSTTTAMSKKNSLQRMPIYFGKREKNYIDLDQDLNLKSISNNELFEFKDNKNPLFSGTSRRRLANIKDFDSKYTIPIQINTQGFDEPFQLPSRSELLGAQKDPTIKYFNGYKEHTERHQRITNDDYDYTGPRTLSDYFMKFPELENHKENSNRTPSVLSTKSKMPKQNKPRKIKMLEIERNEKSERKAADTFNKRSKSNQKRFFQNMDASLGTVWPLIARIRSDIFQLKLLTRHVQLPDVSKGQQIANSDAISRKRRFRAKLSRMPQFYGKRTPSLGKL